VRTGHKLAGGGKWERGGGGKLKHLIVKSLNTNGTDFVFFFLSFAHAFLPSSFFLLSVSSPPPPAPPNSDHCFCRRCWRYAKWLQRSEVMTRPGGGPQRERVLCGMGFERVMLQKQRRPGSSWKSIFCVANNFLAAPTKINFRWYQYFRWYQFHQFALKLISGGT
jgi:hypothetical protein